MNYLSHIEKISQQVALLEFAVQLRWHTIDEGKTFSEALLAATVGVLLGYSLASNGPNIAVDILGALFLCIFAAGLAYWEHEGTKISLKAKERLLRLAEGNPYENSYELLKGILQE